jgi:pimeloyl-ACP methyl ester carboxylesterase
MGGWSAQWRTASVVSGDGVTIGYRRIGTGPGLVLTHGGLMTSGNFRVLAESLAASFTVSVPDRRGRGLSTAEPRAYGLRPEVDDVRAVVAQTGSTMIFGLSSGAVVPAFVALGTPVITKVALYEPPLSDQALTWVTRYEQDVARNDLAAAFVTVLKGTGDDGPMARVPRFALRPLMALAMRAQRREADPHAALADLVPTMRYDARVVADAGEDLTPFRSLRAEVLLLGGRRSAAYLRSALDRLESALPDVERVEIPDVGHTAADNDWRPDLVATELLRFFTRVRPEP